MIWRWILRGLTLALLTLCVTAWVGSYFGGIGIDYWGNTYLLGSSLGDGELFLSNEDLHLRDHSGWVWTYFPYETTLHDAQITYEESPYYCLGFAWKPDKGPDTPQYIMIPLWFPPILSTGLLWLVWRKTRPKYSGKGFPVEVGEKTTKP